MCVYACAGQCEYGPACAACALPFCELPAVRAKSMCMQALQVGSMCVGFRGLVPGLGPDTSMWVILGMMMTEKSGLKSRVVAQRAEIIWKGRSSCEDFCTFPACERRKKIEDYACRGQVHAWKGFF
eukprot:1140219-Pelagomonas_calceolata.AAC.2